MSLVIFVVRVATQDSEEPKIYIPCCIAWIMPELPEVEMARRYLESSALHIRIREVTVMDRRILAGAAGSGEEERLGQCLPGRQFSEAVRHGKRIFLKLKRKDPAEGKMP